MEDRTKTRQPVPGGPASATDRSAGAKKAEGTDAFRVSEAEKKRILKERAKRLSSVSAQAFPVRTDEIDCVEFMLAHERYAFETGCVREICPLNDLTPVPLAPPFVLGVVNLRGQVLSVIDIKKFFDLPEKGITDLNKVIILSSPEMEFGVLADSVIGVRAVKASELTAGLVTLTGIREEYLKGVTPDRLAVLDGKRLLSDKGILVNDTDA